MEKNFFLKKSKADVIEELKKKKLKFNIPLTFSFTIYDWNKKKKLILDTIFRKFDKKKYIAIRSSSRSEDSKNESQAGKFSSFLNIPIRNKIKIISTINLVIRSYKTKKKLNDQVFIQEMISNTSVSGVIFTKDIDTGLNYYVINYDDITGKTDTVTSGKGIHSNRTLFIFKEYEKKIKSPRFKKLIECVVDLEKQIKNNEIDIEFAITKKLKPFLLQARSISTTRNWTATNIQTHEKSLLNAEKNLKKIFIKPKKVLGNKTILGQMPDWNPIEMIGKHPSELSYSLYKMLITDKTWGKARAIMGYRNMSNFNLMHRICGQPYIDTRLCLNSFLPKTLPKKISKKIVNYGISQLKLAPQYHDKIEFEISNPSFAFDSKKKISNRFSQHLTKKEIKIFKDILKNFTQDLIIENAPFSLSEVSKKVEYLKDKYEEFNTSKIKELPKLIKLCKDYGTLNFSIAARHGFVAITFLNSLINIKVLSEVQVEKFEQSLNTITKKMLFDQHLVGKKKLSVKKFMEKYGHLRPGSYDITSKRYDQINNFNFNISKDKIKKNLFQLSIAQKKKINELLKMNGFKNMNHETFFKYLGDAISLREYSKFIFTKYLSLILEIIANYGNRKNISRKELTSLNISNFLNSRTYKDIKNLKKLSKKNLKDYLINKKIKLPLLIQDLSNIRVIPYQVSSPNFITHKKVKGQVLLNPDLTKTKNLTNKIILIENADPGYDWIFGYEILGLITKYGGINSHMSIRCSELSIPAVIGCGEEIFSNLINNRSIYLDCSSSVIYSI